MGFLSKIGKAVGGAATGFVSGGPLGALVGGGAALLGAGAEEAATNKAIKAQRQAAAQQIGIAKQYNEPYTQAGTAALTQLQALLGLPIQQAAPVPTAAPATTPAQGSPADSRLAFGLGTRWSGIHGDPTEGLQPGTPEYDAAVRGSSGPGGRGGMPQIVDMMENVAGTVNATVAPPAAPATLTPQQILEQTPGYQFTLQQAEQALQREAARTGTATSPALLMELMKTGTGLAQQTYGSYLDRLAAMAGEGRVAAGQITGTAVPAYGAVGQTTGLGAMASAASFNKAIGTGAGSILDLLKKTQDKPDAPVTNIPEYLKITNPNAVKP